MSPEPARLVLQVGAREGHLGTGARPLEHETQNRVDSVAISQVGKARAQASRTLVPEAGQFPRGETAQPLLSAVLKPPGVSAAECSCLGHSVVRQPGRARDREQE